ncbi:hypothetical protein MALU111345_19200 [Marinicrinis lubricantis]
MGVDAVTYAKSLLPHVQYSTEDAFRSDFEYLWKTIEAVVKAGATMNNVAPVFKILNRQTVNRSALAVFLHRIYHVRLRATV